MITTHFTSKLVVVYAVFGSLQYTHAYDDGGLVEGCSEDEIAFGCKQQGTSVVVKNAWIHNEYYRAPKNVCHIPEYNEQFKIGSVLQHINKKCASANVCRFNLLDDVVGARQNTKWKGSVIRLEYECVAQEPMKRSCGDVIQGQAGWLQNGGYPKYYLGPGACTFTIRVDVGQKINLHIYDLSMKEIVQPKESECTDKLTVTEGRRVLVSECGTVNKPISVQSYANVLNITLHSGTDVVLKRGFVAHFKANGCPTPAIPANGYLSYRNAKHLQFVCHDRHVFPDTMKKFIELTCLRNDQWNVEVPDCVDLEELYLFGNISEQEYWKYNGSSAVTMDDEAMNYTTDITVPTIIMVLMLGLNVIVLVVIRSLKLGSKEEELDDLKDNVELKMELLDESVKV